MGSAEFQGTSSFPFLLASSEQTQEENSKASPGFTVLLSFEQPGTFPAGLAPSACRLSSSPMQQPVYLCDRQDLDIFLIRALVKLSGHHHIRCPRIDTHRGEGEDGSHLLPNPK